MKTSMLLGLSLVVLLSMAGAARTTKQNPVMRVVALMKGLAEKTEEEGKKEQDLYETYVCWAKTVIETKTASNEAAENRIQSLEAHIADLDAGRLDLTGTGGEMTKEVGGLRSDMETAKALREEEHEDFKAAKKEMEQGISALEKAIEVLKEATKDSKEGVLLRVKEKITEGFHQRQAESLELERAVQYGNKFLTAGDAMFLEHLLTGDVQRKPSKKKATFKMKYKMRSGKIQGVLEKLLDTFKDNLKQAKDKEDDAKDEYDKLMEAKGNQLDEAEGALNDMNSETGARGLAKEDAEQEVSDLKGQMDNDKKYIKETQDALKEKKEEYFARKDVRTAELAAISKAINILYSDEARDTFAKSTASQGLLLLQTKRSSSMHEFTAGVAARLTALARKVKDDRVAALATSIRASSGGAFSKIIKMTEKIIKNIEEEGKKDKAVLKTCKDDLKDNTADAREFSNTMDELADDITNLEADIKDLEEEIKDKEEQVKKTEDELDKATRVRDDEHADWEKNDAADKSAAELVGKSKDVLEDFYSSHALLLVQNRLHQAPEFQSAAGEAPPPPPAVNEGTYKGNQDAGMGIIGILEMVKGDIEKDCKAAKKEEDESQKTYDKFKSGAEEKIKNLEDAISNLEGQKADKEDSVKTNKRDRMTKNNELKEVLDMMHKVQPECDYMLLNFDTREDDRKAEIKGLKEEKELIEEKQKEVGELLKK